MTPEAGTTNGGIGQSADHPTPEGAPTPEPVEPRPAEERAEELMERVAGDVSTFLNRFAGRAREELEDILAEARSVREGWKNPPGSDR